MIKDVRITELKRISGKPFITKAEAAEELNATEKTVRNRMNEIEQLKERYGEYAIIRDGGIVMINYLVWIDYLHFRQMLRQKNAKKFVPPYDPAKVAHDLGWYEMEVV